MGILMDFLSIVIVNGHQSKQRNLDRGCIQGSVLSPALFSVYWKDLEADDDE